MYIRSESLPTPDFLLLSQQGGRGRLGVLFGREGGLAALLVLAPPAQKQPFGQLVFAADLGGPFLAARNLAAQVEFELPRESARGFGGHGLLLFGSVYQAEPDSLPAGVDSIQWYGQRGSLHDRYFQLLYVT